MIKRLEQIENFFWAILARMAPKIYLRLLPFKIYFKYIFAGGTAAVVDLGLLAFFKEIVGMHYLLSAALAFIAAFCVSFALQKFWTFSDKSTDKMHKQAAFYFLIAVANLALNTLLMFIFVDLVHIWYMLSQVLASGLIAFTSFVIYRRYVFVD